MIHLPEIKGNALFIPSLIIQTARVIISRLTLLVFMAKMLHQQRFEFSSHDSGAGLDLHGLVGRRSLSVASVHS